MVKLIVNYCNLAEVSNSEWVSDNGDAAEATTSATDAPMVRSINDVTLNN